jgi:class 3 adenylate cyclase/alpha-beta hydrolase superfamily lysophospholipase
VRVAAVRPETRYVEVDDTQVGYQVWGDGALDVVLMYGLGSHVDLSWDERVDRIADGLASFARLIQFDRRGTGVSGGSREAPPTWEEWTADLEAVLDAAHSETAALIAEVDAGPIAMLFAATHPERVRALILANTLARCLRDVDYPIGATPDELDAIIEFVRAQWGTVELARAVNPRRADDEAWVTAFSRQMRAAAPPHTAAAQYRYIFERLDVREALPLIQASTLVLHNTHHPFVPVEHGRYLARNIDGATLVELHSEGAALDDPLREALDVISEFLTGHRVAVPIDRVLTTVLFTDIVESTQQVVALGDQRWRELLDAHDHAVREQLRRFRGREIKTTGDGFFAAFDGPGRAIHCARAIIEAATQLGLAIRAGLHTGECEVRGEDLGGVCVHIAARVSALAGPGETLVTSTVRDMVDGSGITFDDRGLQSLKGLPDKRQVLAVRTP